MESGWKGDWVNLLSSAFKLANQICYGATMKLISKPVQVQICFIVLLVRKLF